MAKDWKQHEVWDHTYDLSDLLDWHEMSTVNNENRLRAEAVPREGG